VLAGTEAGHHDPRPRGSTSCWPPTAQFGSATALQTSGGFLRNATFEGQAR
jgi:hypothetical protein